MEKALLTEGPGLDKICIATAGSDGRKERGFISPLDIIVYHGGLGDGDKDVLRRALCDLKDESGQSLVDGRYLEFRDIGQGSMDYAYQKEGEVFPSRVFDSNPVIGDERILREAKLRLIEELCGDQGKSMHQRLGDRKRAARKLMMSGEQTWRGARVKHFDLEEGKAYYTDQEIDGQKVSARATKHGPLRYIQISIEQAVVGLVRALARREGTQRALEAVAGMPTPTIEKLDHLGRMGHIRLDDKQIESISESYGFFLETYHASELAALSGRCSIDIPAEETAHRIAQVSFLLGKEIVKG